MIQKLKWTRGEEVNETQLKAGKKICLLENFKTKLVTPVLFIFLSLFTDKKICETIGSTED
jgi:hypothetical protein